MKDGNVETRELLKLISEIEYLLTQPISYKTSERMKQLIRQLISQLTDGVHSNTTNGNGSVEGSNNTGGTSTSTKKPDKYEDLKNRRALRRKERDSLRKNKADTLTKNNGKNC